MISYLTLRNGLKKIAKPTAALLLATGLVVVPKLLLDRADRTSAPGNSTVAEVSWQPLHLHRQHNHPPKAPEANAGLVLIPIVVALMLLSSRQILGRPSGTK
jgi:hypothetical protein